MELRRQFELPLSDVEFLDRHGCPWETISENGLWVLVHDFHTPEGYNHSTVTAAISISLGYPDAPLDMVYFHPGLKRKDGCDIKQTGVWQEIDGRSYQRWSRHHAPENPCLENGAYGLETHMCLIEDWLAREFNK